MSGPRGSRSGELEVLVYAPIGRDGRLTCEVLARAGIAATAATDDLRFCEALSAGVGAALIAEEALQPALVSRLSRVLEEQPPWSEVPLVVFARAAAVDLAGLLEPLGGLGNVVVLERPTHIRPLLSVVRSALRARRRQYETRDLLERQREADRRKDEFLAMLGHELRNPLAAIRTASALLKRQMPELAAARPVEVIDRQSGNLQRLLDDLLEVARTVSGKIVLRLQPIDLAEVAERARASVSPEAARRGHELRAELTPVWVEADPVRLEQVTVNLLHNAIKYTPEGGHIVLRVRPDGEAALLAVQDDGTGVDPGFREVMFEAFRQADSSLNRAGGGLGLGLPLVKHLVELHRGEVAHQDGPGGRGSLFTVRLPARSAPPSRGSSGAWEAPEQPRSGRRVVLVEDNADLRESLGDLLRDLGHQVLTAGDGPSGLALILAERPDVALVDIGLPGLDGYDLARTLRSRSGPRLQLVALTGYGHAEARRRIAEAGFDAHLIKPVGEDSLARLLAQTPDAPRG